VDTEPGSPRDLKPGVGRALQVFGRGNFRVSSWERRALIQPQNPSGQDAGKLVDSLIGSRRRVVVERSHGHLQVELPTATFASRLVRCLAWELGAAKMRSGTTYLLTTRFVFEMAERVNRPGLFGQYGVRNLRTVRAFSEFSWSTTTTR
jgi:hypothetical protein